MISGPEFVLAAARGNYARTAWTHKIHEKQREIWAHRANQVKWGNVLLAGATTALAIVATATDHHLLALTAISAFLTVCFAVGQAVYDPQSREESHRMAAKEFLRLRDEFLMLIADCRAPSGREAGQNRLEVLERELHAICKFAPDTSPQAYNAAKVAIDRGEVSFTDEEIDRLLPAELRKGRPQPV